MFKTIEMEAQSVVVEKKSKFIANIFYVSSVKEAEEIIERTRKKYYDARHNCYAYRIIEESGICERQSDDGEPSGTAGAPMLNILKKKEVFNVLVIVTRYFGGILLGTGGLVRAYSSATLNVINETSEVEKEEGYVLEVVVSYDMQKEFEHFCDKNAIKIVSKAYEEKINNVIEISTEKYKHSFQKNKLNSFQKFPIKIKEKKYINRVK